MVSEQKVRMMIRLAEYESHEGNRILHEQNIIKWIISGCRF